METDVSFTTFNVPAISVLPLVAVTTNLLVFTLIFPADDKLEFNITSPDTVSLSNKVASPLILILLFNVVSPETVKIPEIEVLPEDPSTVKLDGFIGLPINKSPFILISLLFNSPVTNF